MVKRAGVWLCVYIYPTCKQRVTSTRAHAKASRALRLGEPTLYIWTRRDCTRAGAHGAHAIRRPLYGNGISSSLRLMLHIHKYRMLYTELSASSSMRSTKYSGIPVHGSKYEGNELWCQNGHRDGMDTGEWVVCDWVLLRLETIYSISYVELYANWSSARGPCMLFAEFAETRRSR